jgi:hypothetical protein
MIQQYSLFISLISLYLRTNIIHSMRQMSLSLTVWFHCISEPTIFLEWNKRHCHSQSDFTVSQNKQYSLNETNVTVTHSLISLYLRTNNIHSMKQTSLSLTVWFHCILEGKIFVEWNKRHCHSQSDFTVFWNEKYSLNETNVTVTHSLISLYLRTNNIHSMKQTSLSLTVWFHCISEQIIFVEWSKRHCHSQIYFNNGALQYSCIFQHRECPWYDIIIMSSTDHNQIILTLTVHSEIWLLKW